MPPADICNETDVGKVRQCVAADLRSPAKVHGESHWPNAVAERYQRSEERHGIRRGAVELVSMSLRDEL